MKSISYDQQEILAWIQALHIPEGYEADLTYGNGGFWKDSTEPRLCYDIEPLRPHVIKADSRSLPLADKSLSNCVFDPPFLTYINNGNGRGGGSIMGDRFSGYDNINTLLLHYRDTIRECGRILKTNGVLVFKCQDIVHDHKFRCTHQRVMEMAEAEGFRTLDLFVLIAKHRIPVNGAKSQRHARIHHSYFLVFKKR